MLILEKLLDESHKNHLGTCSVKLFISDPENESNSNKNSTVIKTTSFCVHRLQIMLFQEKHLEDITFRSTERICSVFVQYQLFNQCQ